MPTDLELLQQLQAQRAALSAQPVAPAPTGLLRPDLGQEGFGDLFRNPTEAQSSAIGAFGLSLLGADRNQRLSQSIAQALSAGKGALESTRATDFAGRQAKRAGDLEELETRFGQRKDIAGVRQAQERIDKPGGPLVTVNTGENKFGTEFNKKFAQKIIEDRTGAEEAQDSLRATVEARQLLDDGVITGTGATFITNVGAALQQAGFNVSADPVANTQAFVAVRAQEVGRIIKLFGAGTGLSDADREFATQAAAGDVTITRGAIDRILEINERASRNVINRFNKNLKLAPAGSIPEGFEIQLPPTRKEREKARNFKEMTDNELLGF